MINPGTEILSVDPAYLHHLLINKNVTLGRKGGVSLVRGFDDYNHLVEINGIFSQTPRGDPCDRTGRVVTPLKIYAGRKWPPKDISLSLDQALRKRVRDLEDHKKTINIMWSGGVDSTTVVNAFIEHAQHRDQIRVLYTPFSEYEHGEYLGFLRDLGIETIDISGMVYLENYFDGLFVTGDGGDEHYASIDESFLETNGYDALTKPWQDFFKQTVPNKTFMEFCENYFSWAGQEIKTLLEARWWFYINSKYRCILNEKLHFWVDHPEFDKNLVLGFFDFDEFDQYVRHRIHEFINRDGYQTWKQDLKNYCASIDGFQSWCRDKRKVNSNQLHLYANKKRMFKNLHWIFILDDGRRISTPNMPLFSIQELEATHGSALDCLWNEPAKI